MEKSEEQDRECFKELLVNRDLAVIIQEKAVGILTTVKHGNDFKVFYECNFLCTEYYLADIFKPMQLTGEKSPGSCAVFLCNRHEHVPVVHVRQAR